MKKFAMMERENLKRMVRFLWAVTIGLLLAIGMAACTPENRAAKPELEKPAPGQLPISPTSNTGTVTLTLYFADWQAQYVVPEERVVSKGDKSVEQLAMEELLKGPRDPYLKPGVPNGTKLISVQVKDGVAYVNLSSEMGRVQGSAGSAMAGNSIVWTMTELPGIKKVQILVDGEKWTVEGHGTMTEPVGRRILIQPVFLDTRRAEWLQSKVDKGQETWRLDPLEVAKFEGRMFGFFLTDKFELVRKVAKGQGSGTGEAEVKVTRDNTSYVIQLIQPVKSGDQGIWVINSFRVLEK